MPTRFKVKKGFLLGIGMVLGVLTRWTGDLHADVLQLSLREAIALSIERNEDIRVAREGVGEREARIREIRADVLPKLTGDFSYTRNIQLPVLFFETEEGIQQFSIGEDNAYFFNLSLEQTLDVFGRTPKALDVAHLYADIGKETADQVEGEVVFDVKSAYYDAVLAEALHDVANLSLEQADANLRQVELMVNEGTKSRFDLLRARVEVANRRPELIRAENRSELAKSRLKRVIGLPLDREIELIDPLVVEPLDMSLEEGIALALSRRPELRSIRMDEEMGELQVGLARLERYPSFFLSSSYSIQGQTDNAFPENREIAKSWGASIGLKVPIFDGLRTSGLVEQAKARLSMIRYRRKKIEEEVRLEVIESFRDLETAEEEIRSQQANVDEAKEAYRLAVVRFSSGLTTQLEVQDVELALNRARTNYIQSLYNYSIARARVEKATAEK